MFLHIYKYRLKSFFREKEEFFWCLIFPLILFLCFKVAFSAIADKEWTFHSIPVAVVFEQENALLEETLNSIATDNSQGEEFLKITNTDYDSAKALLEDKKVDGIILVNDEITLIVSKTGLNQTALHSFINMYLQQADAVVNIAAKNPAAIEDFIASISEDIEFIKKDSIANGSMDPMESYYFSLIAFAALSGGYYGIRCATQQKANTSKEGLRKSISSTRKSVLLTAELCATYTLHLIIMAALVFVIFFIMKLDFGGKIGYVALTCAIGSFTGVSNGLLLGSLPKIKGAIQTVIYVGYTLISAFLSGLMVGNMKILIEHYVPIINRLNPATLIADSFYALTMFDTYERFFTNLATLAIIGVLSLVVSIVFTRRKSYASL